MNNSNLQSQQINSQKILEQQQLTNSQYVGNNNSILNSDRKRLSNLQTRSKSPQAKLGASFNEFRQNSIGNSQYELSRSTYVSPNKLQSQNHNLSIGSQQQLNGHSASKQKQQQNESNVTQNNIVYNQMNDIKQKLRIIFVFYTSFGDRTNITNLKSNRFHKLIEDAQIYDNIVTKKKLDLLFVQENKHQSNMQFNTFLNLLPKIGLLKYPQLTSEKALLELFFNHLNPLNQSILKDTDLGEDLEKFSEPIENDCVRVMKTIAEMLAKIYEVYFPWEPVNSLTQQQFFTKSLAALFKFLKDFDICPKYLTKSVCFLLFNDLIDTPVQNISHSNLLDGSNMFGFNDRGKLFSLNRFLVFIIRCALIGFSNSNNQNSMMMMQNQIPYNTQVEKLNALLERMELSEGFLNFERKTHCTHNEKTSLLIPKNLLNQLSMEGSLELDLVRSHRFSQDNHQMQSMQQSKILMESKIFSRCKSPEKSKAKSTLLDSLQFTLDIIPVLEKYNDTLQRIFKFYTSFGEPLNTQTLKSSKLLKLLRDAQILRKEESFNGQNYQSYKNSINFNNSQNSRILNNNQSLVNNPNNNQRVLRVIEVDFIVAKLTGHGWIKNYNKKTKGYNMSIQSPNLGATNYQCKNQLQQGAKGKLEYEHFLKFLEEMATKLYPEYDTEQALTIILEQNILPLDCDNQIKDLNQNQSIIMNQSTMQQKQQTDYLQLLMTILKDQSLVEVLSDIHKSLFVYYRYYADSKGLLNVQKFVQFGKDFEIFPDLISKAKLHQIFYSLSTLYKNNEEQIQSQQQLNQINSQSQLGSIQEFNQTKIYRNDQTEDDLIDQHLFVEATALIACEIYQSEPILAYKQLMLIERINASNGPKKIQKDLGHTRSTTGISWDILDGVRNKYQSFYIKNQKRSKTFVQGNFDNTISKALQDNTCTYIDQTIQENDNQQQNGNQNHEILLQEQEQENEQEQQQEQNEQQSQQKQINQQQYQQIQQNNYMQNGQYQE